MPNQTFLDRLAGQLLLDHPDDLHRVEVVLPSRRAKVFLTEAIRRQATTNIFAPKITNIEDFVSELAGIRSMDPTELHFEFYNVYSSLHTGADKQSFDVFSNWAKTLLQDFNEIDRYLIDPKHVLKYLQDIEDIRRWGQDEQPLGLVKQYVDFWKMLPIYYNALQKHLNELGAGYQGLIYRRAVSNLAHSQLNRKLIFAGFNALNAAEEQIFKHFLAEGAQAYWDADKTFLKDELHGAGLFLSRIKGNWSYYKSHDFKWVFDNFSQPKNIEVIGTAKSIGQARIAGSIIEKLLQQGANMSRTAIVLGDEQLLVPLLHALPGHTGPLNITMGLPGKNNPAQVLIAKMFRMHTAALKRSGEGYVLYHKDVTDILSHPMVSRYPGVRAVAADIIQNNYSFIPHSTLMNFGIETGTVPGLIFSKWNSGALDILTTISAIIQTIRAEIPDDESGRVTLAFLHAAHQMVNRLMNAIGPYADLLDADMLFSMYRQAAELAEVSFEGEPLEGLQIMGILESRVLDFENVVVLSMNEGKLPAGKSGNSFIPNDLKRELNLPTYKEKDAVYTYHFYHLLQRATQIYLLYNNDSEGFDGGEKSRFITQLEVEKQPAHTLVKSTYAAAVPAIASRPLVVKKTPLVMERLAQIAVDGFSPSALTSYIRNPIDFYYRKILRIRETEDVEESIAVNTLGTIIHETLKELYNPFIGGLITIEGLEWAIKESPGEVLRQFKNVYREGEIRKGRNFLAFEVAKRHVLNFLRMELDDIRQGAEIQIIALETNYGRTLENMSLPYPVRIAGNVDRIDIRNGVTRIIDYKTGRVDARNLKLKDWGQLIDSKNDKIIQVLAYSYMFCEKAHPPQLTAGIISFKNMREGYMPFTFESGKEKNQMITTETLDDFCGAMLTLLAEILDSNADFEEKQIKFS